MLITVDTGGTKTLVASFSEDGEIAHSVRFPTPKDQDEYITTLLEVLGSEFEGTIDTLSIAAPAVIEDGVIKMCSNLPWKNFPLVERLKAHYACPILLGNDSKLAGLAEARAITPSPKLCLYVTISTGIGIGVTSNGHLVHELVKSEAGRMILEYDGILRDWESFASGRAIYERYGKYASEITSKRAWRDIADTISRGLLVLIPTIEPDVVVIGGSIGTYFEHYGETLAGLLKERLPALIAQPVIVKAKHPEQAVIYGCYYYAIDTLTDSKA